MYTSVSIGHLKSHISSQEIIILENAKDTHVWLNTINVQHNHTGAACLALTTFTLIETVEMFVHHTARQM